MCRVGGRNKGGGGKINKKEKNAKIYRRVGSGHK